MAKIFTLGAVMGLRIKLRENHFHVWIIVPAENERLAWTGSRWVPIDRDGLSVGGKQVASFVTVKYAAEYAQSVGFDVEHGSAPCS